MLLPASNRTSHAVILPDSTFSGDDDFFTADEEPCLTYVPTACAAAEGDLPQMTPLHESGGPVTTNTCDTLVVKNPVLDNLISLQINKQQLAELQAQDSYFGP